MDFIARGVNDNASRLCFTNVVILYYIPVTTKRTLRLWICRQLWCEVICIHGVHTFHQTLTRSLIDICGRYSTYFCSRYSTALFNILHLFRSVTGATNLSIIFNLEMLRVVKCCSNCKRNIWNITTNVNKEQKYIIVKP